MNPTYLQFSNEKASIGGSCKIREIIELIDEMRAHGTDALKVYAETLQGPRERGSTTTHGLRYVEDGRAVARIQKGATPPAVLYQFDAPELGGKLKAFPFKMIQSHIGRPVFVEEGDHGIELVIQISREERHQLETAWGKSGEVISVLIGPYSCPDGSEWNGRDVVYTWHPGPVLGTLSCGIQPMTAVKAVVGST